MLIIVIAYIISVLASFFIMRKLVEYEEKAGVIDIMTVLTPVVNTAFTIFYLGWITTLFISGKLRNIDKRIGRTLPDKFFGINKNKEE